VAERQPPDEGLCVAICTLQAPPSLGRILRVLAGPPGAGPPTEVLLVHGDEVRSRIQTMLREAGPLVRVRSLVAGGRGFSIDRRSALDWAGEHRGGWSVLFLDDDDVPERDLIPRLWAAHLQRPHDIVAGVVVADGAPAPAKAPPMRPVAYHGASTMLIPARLVRDSASWLPRRVDHCGGEDTALCAEAGRRGVRIWEVRDALAHAVRPDPGGLVEYEARRALHEGWVFSSLCRTGVIRGWRASAPGRLASAAWNAMVASVLVVRGRRRTAKRHLARGVGALCGLFLTPPARTWLLERPARRR
jgi:Glycosyl transferase family 2